MIVVFWKWKKEGYRSKFSAAQVNIAKAMVQRNCTLPLEFICITDDAAGLDPDIRPIKLWPNPAPEYGNGSRPNCTYRIKAFADEMREVIGEKFIWFDLDMVVTGNLDSIIGAHEDFMMWGDTGKRPQYNGSLCLMRAGAFPKVWTDFKGNASINEAWKAGFFGSDQSWISYKMGPNHRKLTTQDGIYSYKNHYRDYRIVDVIPGCKIVFFHGQFDPWHSGIMEQYPWVRDNYRL